MTESKISRTHVLYSPGYGAGWTTWNSSIPKPAREMMLRHAGLIAAINAGDRPTVEHPAVAEFIADMDAMGVAAEELYLGGLRDIATYPTTSRVRVDEYDGNESVTEEGEDEWL